MSRRLWGLLPACAAVVALLVASLHVVDRQSSVALAAETSRWRPRLGAIFNNPVLGPAARTAIVSRVRRAIDHTPRGATIRFAMYSFDRKDIADALVRAHARGVNVQMLVNDNWISEPTRRLMRRLGSNPSAQSFVRLCEGACRGGPGNLHLKVYAFTQSGTARNVVMTGSANMTRRGVDLQWNDLYTIYDQGLHDTLVRVFNELKRDRPVSPRWVEYSSGEVDAEFHRERSTDSEITVTEARLFSQSEDPILKRLRAISCRAEPGYGLNGHTTLRIMMYGWNGERGRYLADRVAYMQRQGCNVKVIVSAPGRAVVRTLKDSGVRVRSADWLYLVEVGLFDLYPHLKVLTVNGTYEGRNTQSVWTGSENWSSMSLRNDELTIRVHGGIPHQEYIDRFKTLWDHATHAVGLYPTYKPVW